jgi:hypothetical protein
MRTATLTATVTTVTLLSFQAIFNLVGCSTAEPVLDAKGDAVSATSANWSAGATRSSSDSSSGGTPGGGVDGEPACHAEGGEACSTCRPHQAQGWL